MRWILHSVLCRSNGGVPLGRVSRT